LIKARRTTSITTARKRMLKLEVTIARQVLPYDQSPWPGIDYIPINFIYLNCLIHTVWTNLFCAKKVSKLQHAIITVLRNFIFIQCHVIFGANILNWLKLNINKNHYLVFTCENVLKKIIKKNKYICLLTWYD
jgi:hypothetical protein